MFQLRDYQREAIDAIHAWFEESSGNPLVVVPTGGGKSVIIAEFIREVLTEWPDQRILVATHVKELVDQNYRTLMAGWPEAPAGIYSAGMRRRDTRDSVIFCSVQSAYRRWEQFGTRNLLIVDEVHLVPPSGFGMYQQLVQGLKSVNPNLKLIGFTATPFRTDTGRLDKGKDKLFQGIAYEVGVRRLIEEGYLSPLKSKGTAAVVDTTGVKTQRGDYVEKELQAAAMAGDLVARTVDELVARGQDRRAWLVFCCGVDHAEDVARELTKRGISNATVFGKTHRDQRDQRIEAYRRGEIRALVSVGVLTTGFDVPFIDLIAMLRPTQSAGLYVQQVGRGFRIAPGKSECVVLDFAGNVQRHGPVDAVEISERSKSSIDQDQLKKCPMCFELVDLMEAFCPECGHKFAAEKDKRGPDHDHRPDEDNPILSGDPRSPIQRWPVEREIVQRWQAPGKPKPTLRVTYLCGFRRNVNEFIGFEHQGYPRRKAENWWRNRGGEDPVPETVSEALSRIKLHELYEVIQVTVDTRPDYPEIRGLKMDDDLGAETYGPTDYDGSEGGRGDWLEGAVHEPGRPGDDEVPF